MNEKTIKFDAPTKSAWWNCFCILFFVLPFSGFKLHEFTLKLRAATPAGKGL